MTTPGRISTPEEIAAWLAGEINVFDDSPPLDSFPEFLRADIQRVDRLHRRALLRLAPECHDYGALVAELERVGRNHYPLLAYVAMTEEQVYAQTISDLALLWQPALAAFTERSEGPDPEGGGV